MRVVFVDDSDVRELGGDVGAIGARPDTSAISRHGSRRGQGTSDYVTKQLSDAAPAVLTDKLTGNLPLLRLWLRRGEYLFHQLGDIIITTSRCR